MLHFCEDVQRSLCLLTAVLTGNVKTSVNPSDELFLLALLSGIKYIFLVITLLEDYPRTVIVNKVSCLCCPTLLY